MNTVAEGCSDLIEENMRVSVAVDPDSYFFVEFDHIIPDFWFVSGPPDQHPSFFVLGNQIKSEDRPTLPILPGPTA